MSPEQFTLRRIVAPLAGSLLLLDVLAYTALTPVLPTLAARHGMSEAMLGLLVGGVAYGTFLASLPASAWSARIGPRRVTLIGATTSGLLLIAFWASNTVGLLIATRLLLGITTPLVWVGAPTWAGLGARTRAKSIARITGMGMLGSVFGPPVGALLATDADPLRAYLWLGLLTLGLAAIGWLRTRTLPHLELGSVVSLRDAVGVLRNRAFMIGIVVVLLAATLGTSEAIVFTLGLDRRGMSIRGLGAVFAFAGIALAVAQMNAHRLGVSRRPGTRALLFGATAAAAMGVALVWSSLPGLAVATVLVASAAGIGYGISLILLTDGAEEAGTTTAVGTAYWSIFWGAGVGLGAPTLGWLLSTSGERTTMKVIAMGILIVTASLWVGGRGGLPSRVKELT